MTSYFSVPLVAGVLMLVWAVVARRSPFDSVLLLLGGCLLILLDLRWLMDSSLGQHFSLWPEFALGCVGLLLLLRAFLSRLGAAHRIGFGLAGCAVTLPLLLLAGLIILFSMGSGHDAHRGNDISSNSH